jgi:tetratricopeptide (TPR) repeat protein
MNRAYAYSELKLFRKALNDYNKVIELDSKASDAYYSRGYTYDDLGMYLQAISDYTRAIKLDKDYGSAYLNRAIAKHLYGIDGCDDIMKARELGTDVHPEAIEEICN